MLKATEINYRFRLIRYFANIAKIADSIQDAKARDGVFQEARRPIAELSKPDKTGIV